MLENGLSAATVFLGAMYGGYVVSPINLLAQDAQLEYTLTHSEARLVFATAGEPRAARSDPTAQRVRRSKSGSSASTGSNCPPQRPRVSHSSAPAIRRC